MSDLQQPLRLVSWNIRGGRGAPGSRAASRSALENAGCRLRALEPSVALLQEVDRRSLRSSGRDQVRTVARSAGLEPVVWAAYADGSFGEGMVLLRGECIDVPFAVGVPLQEGRSPHRCLLVADVQPTGWPLTRIVQVHQSGTVRQPGELADVLQVVRRDQPTVVIGDFNVTSDSQAGDLERRVLGSVGLHDAFGDLAPGSPERGSFGPARHLDLDRAYCSPHLQVARAWIDDSALQHSDHAALVLDLIPAAPPADP